MGLKRCEVAVSFARTGSAVCVARFERLQMFQRQLLRQRADIVGHCLLAAAGAHTDVRLNHAPAVALLPVAELISKQSLKSFASRAPAAATSSILGASIHAVGAGLRSSTWRITHPSSTTLRWCKVIRSPIHRLLPQAPLWRVLRRLGMWKHQDNYLLDTELIIQDKH